MLPKCHIFFGLIFSALICFIFRSISFIGISIIFLSSVLIDLDHYLFYVCKTNDFSLKNSLAWFAERRQKFMKMTLSQKEKFKRQQIILHGIEFFIPLVILSCFYPVLNFVLIGVAFHMTLDFIEIFYLKERFYQKISQVYVYFTNKKKQELH
jgi:hypothetical protein